MTESGGRRLFALDHNFPQPIVDVLSEWIDEAELVPIQEIDERLPDFENDWEILLALHHHERPWDGLITTDSSMLNLPRELSVLMQTKLTLVVIKESGHDPIKATGLLFAYLPNVCKRSDPGTAQLWTPGAASTPATKPWDRLATVAGHQHRTATELWEEHKLDDDELARDPLA